MKKLIKWGGARKNSGRKKKTEKSNRVGIYAEVLEVTRDNFNASAKSAGHSVGKLLDGIAKKL